MDKNLSYDEGIKELIKYLNTRYKNIRTMYDAPMRDLTIQFTNLFEQDYFIRFYFNECEIFHNLSLLKEYNAPGITFRYIIDKIDEEIFKEVKSKLYK